MLIFRFRILSIVIFCFFLFSNAKAVVHSTKLSHHIFNSNLLNPFEYKFSLFGSVNVGLTSNLEIGSHILAWVLSSPNLSVKNKIYQNEKHQLSAFIHFFSASSSLLRSFEIDALHGVAIPISIMDTIQWKSNLSFNLGLFDLAFFLKMDDLSEYSEFHFIFPTFGFDWFLLPNVFINISLYYPIVSLSYLNNSFIKVNENRLYWDRYAIFLSATCNYGKAYFEIGYFYIKNFLDSFPYINLYWKV